MASKDLEEARGGASGDDRVPLSSTPEFNGSDSPYDDEKLAPGEAPLDRHVQQEQQQQQRRRFFLVLAGAAVLILIGAIIAIVFSTQSSGNTPDTNSSSGSSSASSSPPPTTSAATTPSPTPSPTPAPTPAPIAPTPYNTLIRSIALAGGTEFEDPTSPQSRALEWLGTNTNLESYSDQKVIQRYALACIFYGTNAVATASAQNEFASQPIPTWNIQVGWLSRTADECNGSWYGVNCTSSGEVFEMDLHRNNMTGKMPMEITLFKDSLTYLDIQENALENVEGDLLWLGELINLRYLYIGGNYFFWHGLPTFLGQLTELRELDVSYTGFHGPMNAAAIFPNMPHLYYLEMGAVEYNSTIPDEIINLPALERLYMEDSFLSGDLSFLSADRVPFLFELWVDYNPKLGGPIPDSIGTVTTLGSLSVTECSFVGSIPTQVGLLTDMVQMWWYDNQLTGTIPSEIGRLSLLQTFHTEGNDIGGGMPTQVCGLRDTLGGARVLNDLGTDCPTQVTCAANCCTCCGMEECVGSATGWGRRRLSLR